MQALGSQVGSLTSKGQVGVLLGEHRGWILRMAFSYKAKNIAYNSTLCKKYCVQQHAFLCSNIQHSTFHHSLKRMVPLSLQNGKCFASFPSLQHTRLYFPRGRLLWQPADRLSDSSDDQTSDGAHKRAFPYSHIEEPMMSRAHSRQELPCNS